MILFVDGLIVFFSSMNGYLGLKRGFLEEIGRVRAIEIDNFGDIYVGVENLGIVKLTK